MTPTDGAMLSPYGPAPDLTLDAGHAYRAIERAEALAVRLKRELALAMAADNRADAALQDAWGWVTTMLDTELPAAKRALDEGVG
jgi:hypothetical protein